MRFMVTCMDDHGNRVLASRSKIFDGAHSALVYEHEVAPERKPLRHMIVDAEKAAEDIHDYIIMNHFDDAFDVEKARALLREEDSRDGTVTMVIVANEGALGYPKADKKYFDDYFRELVLDGGEE
jgi:hypothetical protein